MESVFEKKQEEKSLLEQSNGETYTSLEKYLFSYDFFNFLLLGLCSNIHWNKAWE